MIYFNEEEKDIHLQTAQSSYIIRILEEGHAAHLYFGRRLENRPRFSSLYKRRETAAGVAYTWGSSYSMVGEPYEFSWCDKGDYRESSLDLLYGDGSVTSDFKYHSHSIDGEKLVILLKDPVTDLFVKLHYQVEPDRIIRHTELENRGEPVRVNRLTWATFDTRITGLRLEDRPVSQGVRVVEAEEGLLVLENEDLIYRFRTEQAETATGMVEQNSHNLVRVHMGEERDFRLGTGESRRTGRVSLSYENKAAENRAAATPEESGTSGASPVETGGGVFRLRTRNLSYCFDREMDHLYFGEASGESRALAEHRESGGKQKEFDADRALRFEGIDHLNFAFLKYELTDSREKLKTLPSAHSCDKCLKVYLTDSENRLDLILTYGIYYTSDCITRSIKIINRRDRKAVVTKALSFTLPVAGSGWSMMTLDGDWAGERHIHTRELGRGITYVDSKKGSSSSTHAPFLGLMKEDTTEFRGPGIGFSLIYSGNHIMQAEQNGSLTVSGGINPHFFAFHIEDEFETPEAVITYSHGGLNRMSQNFHSFVNNHIIPPQFREKERPVLINNWEATYFKFNERKLLSLARTAKKMGIELFVLDDGWFGKRDDDTTSLGDYKVYRKKLRHGLDGLCRKINRLGLDFGLWVEPEMISVDSDLYRKHPEYLIKHPDRELSFGRNQGILDFANPEVVDYVYGKLERVFSSCNLKYVKWDMNRNFSDTWSNHLKDQRECMHRYMMGLYSLFERLMNRFPDILFEGCASGGDRFDMGILCYFPQIWTSDCSDATERTYIKYGTSMVFPPSVMGSHVSSAVNHQLLRKNPLETRFNIAAVGVLGYELDLRDISGFDRKIIRQQISFYKEHRKLLQFGRLTRLESPFESNYFAWMVSDEESGRSIYINFQELVKTSRALEIFRLRGLNNRYSYRITNRPQIMNIKTFGELINEVLPFRIRQNRLIHNMIDRFYPYKSEQEEIEASGTELNCFGFLPKHQFFASYVNENVRVVADFDSRLYMIDREE